jgi:putative SOS response-associated peptidase YedK
MCYDIKTSLEKQLRRAMLDGNQAQIDEIHEKLSIFSPSEIELNHASGFTHPRLIIYTNNEPFKPIISQWGLVPHWVKDQAQKNSFWNKTLNARGETIWEKPSFKSAAQKRRCLVFIEGFYEHHHHKGKTYPYFISHKDKDLFAVAGLWSEWKNPELEEPLNTFSLVTSKANTLMAEIHNNPKLAEPRMPLILPEELQEQWLLNIEEPTDQELIKELVQPYPDDLLVAHTVGRLKGKNALGNVKEVTNEVIYSELLDDPNLKLF